MTRGLDEEQAAVDAGILDITLTLSCELLAKVCRVLILDVLDNRIPAGAMLARDDIENVGGSLRTNGHC